MALSKNQQIFSQKMLLSATRLDINSAQTWFSEAVHLTYFVIPVGLFRYFGDKVPPGW